MSTYFKPVDFISPFQPRMPLEVLENIIKKAGELKVYDWEVPNDRYPTLCAFALSCRALVPRSRIYLFRAVRLNSKERASKFLATISDSTEFGQLVNFLCIDCKSVPEGEHGWIYDTLKILPSHLTNLYEIQYLDLPILHSLFHALSPRFSTIRSLLIKGSKQSFRETIQIINGFKNLESLTVSCGQKTPGHFFLKRSHRLKHLNIKNTFVWQQAKNISLWTVANNSTLQLNIISFPLYPDIILEPAIRNCSKLLENLTLYFYNNTSCFQGICKNFNYQFIYSFLTFLIDHCPQLDNFQCLISISIMFMDTLSENNLWIQLISELNIDNLPNSLEYLYFLFPVKISTEIFSEVVHWSNLDTTLTNTKFSNLKSVQMSWVLQTKYWKIKSIDEDKEIENKNKNKKEQVENQKEIIEDQKINKIENIDENENKTLWKKAVQARLKRLDQENFYQNYFPKLHKNILLYKLDHYSTLMTFFPQGKYNSLF